MRHRGGRGGLAGLCLGVGSLTGCHLLVTPGSQRSPAFEGCYCITRSRNWQTQHCSFQACSTLPLGQPINIMLRAYVCTPSSPIQPRSCPAGQQEAAARLHSNFTAAWATWGWLPELFGADLSAVHPEEPGYNLRPEHIESTWYLKAVSGDPSGHYSGLAAAMMAVLNHSRVGCGYAPIKDVNTGEPAHRKQWWHCMPAMPEAPACV